MSALTAPRVVHHACGHTHRHVLHTNDDIAERETRRLEQAACPTCARTAHVRPRHPDVVDSGLGLQPSEAGDPNHLV